MTDRERYLATMRYQSVDKPFVTEWGYWPETIERWIEEGAPADLHWNSSDDNTSDAYFGHDSYRTYLPVCLDLFPAFEEKQLEDRGETELVQQYDGVQVVQSKRMGSIPHPERFVLTDQESWETHYKPKFDPEIPGRIANNCMEVYQQWTDGGKQSPLVVGPTSMFGWLRNWMGFEEAVMLKYEDPDLLEEIVTTIADCAIATLGKLFDMGIKPDILYFWEDICFNSGPMIDPDSAREFLLPHYKRITDFCKQHGMDLFALDSDGRLDHLIPVWLEGGINIIYPVEIGTCGSDVLELRKTFGKDLRMMGGFDKRILAKGKDEIDAEINRLAPLIKEGGYVAFCDHHVPPDVPLENYQYFIQAVRSV